MKLLTDISALQLAKSVVAVGSFDGIHLGHQKILSTLVDLGAREAVPAVVVTFHPHPALFFKRTENAYYITPRELQAELIAAAGVDYLLVLEFNQEFASQSAEEFLQSLKDACGFSHLVVGYDFALGKNRQGTLNHLALLSREMDFELTVIPQVELPAENPISSSRIRELLQKGQVEDITPLLGRYFSLRGIVNHGQKIGRKLGLPTANIYPEEHQLLPAHGVYITIAVIRGKRYPSVTNIGIRPTIVEGNDQSLSVETYILDFDHEVYGQPLSVEFINYLRPEQKFDTLGELKDQIERDIAETRKVFKDHERETHLPA